MAIRWGVIGCGRIANTRVIPEGMTMAKNAQLAGVADIRHERAAATAANFDVHAFDSAAALLADPTIDAVYIATPPASHAELTVAAAQAGKHVLCQKPIALNAVEGQAMVEACQTAGVLLGIGYMMRYHGAHQKMKELVAAGFIGRPVGARVRYSVWSPPLPPDQEAPEYGAWIHDPKIAGGGPLMDMGVHAIDLLIMILGRISEVAAYSDTLVHHFAVEDSVTALFKFANGAQGILETYMSVPNFEGRRLIEIYGSEGSLVAENTIFQLPSGHLWHYEKRDGGTTNATPAAIPFDQENMYWNEIRQFTEAVVGKTPAPIPGTDGHHIQQVADAIYKSSAERLYVTIPQREPGEHA